MSLCMLGYTLTRAACVDAHWRVHAPICTDTCQRALSASSLVPDAGFSQLKAGLPQLKEREELPPACIGVYQA